MTSCQSQIYQYSGIGADMTQGTVNPLELILRTTCPSWTILAELLNCVNANLQNNTTFLPSQDRIFYAFQLTPLQTVKVVIVGQDPYTSAEQAMGLAFSVPPGVPVPRSLQNIFNVLYNDPNIPGFEIPNSGCLVNWAQQGVLLLNSILTVGDKPKSHAGYGWETFTDNVIKVVSDNCDHVVFILFGKFAHEKEKWINTDKHVVIKPAHPSPLSYRYFRGSTCFSECNQALMGYGIPPINW